MALNNDDKKWLDNKFVTKSDLKMELKKFATKEDLQKFATKEDLTVSNVRLGLEFDKKFEKLENKMDSRFDQLATTMDQILKEVVSGREHDLVVNLQQERQDRRLDKIEDVVGITQ